MRCCLTRRVRIAQQEAARAALTQDSLHILGGGAHVKEAACAQRVRQGIVQVAQVVEDLWQCGSVGNRRRVVDSGEASGKAAGPWGGVVGAPGHRDTETWTHGDTSVGCAVRPAEAVDAAQSGKQNRRARRQPPVLRRSHCSPARSSPSPSRSALLTLETTRAASSRWLNSSSS